ncbi:MAG: OsmC family protein [Pseudomonadales bacterium]|nr:OsmC family protein [Pseudomonadales bacterium]
MTTNKAAKHKAIIHWEKQKDGGEYYSWSFDNGVALHNSNNLSMSSAGLLDPETAFVASLASCHMLSLFAIAAKRGFSVQCYHDEAVGVLEMNPDGRIAVTRILLSPKIQFSDNNTPSPEELEQLMETTHHNCFIANSVKTELMVDTTLVEQ